MTKEDVTAASPKTISPLGYREYFKGDHSTFSRNKITLKCIVY